MKMVFILDLRSELVIKIKVVAVAWPGWKQPDFSVKVDHRVHRVATAAFWRTFSDEGKICPGW
jgi:hypothetical protein